ncbi:hypothetical protein DQ04_00961140 [Trypanosoma grayi]|uniref:hypothetical protein n=1 Tax=Trypanosoma grayi TaxID=71804 RepID=UPI0004F46ACE|nr:hypothetical protein DQ04_00961140 [Trypanosoma grayi]KEG13521.1 hypothetical protein DQ04_00961140 [Trypanosoma grayi]
MELQVGGCQLLDTTPRVGCLSRQHTASFSPLWLAALLRGQCVDAHVCSQEYPHFNHEVAIGTHRYSRRFVCFLPVLCTLDCSHNTSSLLLLRLLGFFGSEP